MADKPTAIEVKKQQDLFNANRKTALSKLTVTSAEEKEVTSADILEKIKVILVEYDNKESDIPHTHVYWTYLNLYRRLRSQNV